MPLMHCTKCHHEWECSDKESCCDWCGSPGRVLEDKTPREIVNWDELMEKFKSSSTKPAKKKREKNEK